MCIYNRNIFTHIITYHIYIYMVTYEWGLKHPRLWENDLSVLCMEHGCRIGCCFLKSLVALEQWRIPVWRLRCWTVPSKVRDVSRVVVCVTSDPKVPKCEIWVCWKILLLCLDLLPLQSLQEYAWHTANKKWPWWTTQLVVNGTELVLIQLHRYLKNQSIMNHDE